MKEQSMNRRIGSRRAGIRRLTAFLLAALLCAQAFSGLTVLAAGEPGAAGAVSWHDLDNRAALGSGQDVTNTYILEVSSGTKQGGGTHDNIQYFTITYRTGSTRRQAIILPREDAVATSVEAAASVASRNSRRQMVTDTFGYATPGLANATALGSVSTDQFLFTTPEAITGIESIQVFGRDTTSASTWACQGMRIYQVDRMYGLEMYGWYSDTPYIDFAGSIIGEVIMGDGGGIFRWSGSGGMFNIRQPNVPNGTAGCVLVDVPHKASFESEKKMTTHVGDRHLSQAQNRVVLRLDLADMGGAGFESLAASYEAGSHTKISDLQLCETAALKIRYKDTFGDAREFAMPLVVNALGQVVEVLGDVEIAGYGQQGDSIAVAALLPDFAELQYVSLFVGQDAAVQAANLSSTSEGGVIRRNRVARSQTDDIRYLCFAVYQDARVQVGLDGATVVYNYQPGEGNPIQYSTATTVEGVAMAAGQENFFSLQNYRAGMVLAPVDRTERYLVTIYTDDVANAGTTGDVQVQFDYVSLKDTELTSEAYRINDYATQFYGEWPGNVSNFAYLYGMRQGGVIQFMVPLQGVRQFTNASFKVDGDEWQVSGMTVALVKSYEGRVAAWKEVESTERDPANTSQARFKSHLEYTRYGETDRVCFSIGTVPDEAGNMPDPAEEGSGWQPGTLIQDDDEWTVINGDTEEISSRDDVDWGTYRRIMTYEDTQQDLGFVRERAAYIVKVKVMGNKTNPDDDDCGSENLFYFQLIFENGKSGVTLANQQIVGDAFRTGATCQFTISCSQDYGDLQSVLIIPDDQDSNSHIYDKLQIERIDIEKKSDDALVPTWEITGDKVNGLGWVGIEYRDEGSAGANVGAKGRSVSEIATTYQVTAAKYSAKLLVAISTGPSGTRVSRDDDFNPITVANPPFSGGVMMNMNYLDTEGRLQTIEGLDIVKAMNEYAGLEDNHTRRYEDGLEIKEEEVTYVVSDTQYHFRAGSTDCFFVTVSNVWQLLDASLNIRSDVVSDWNITDVKVYLVNSQGQRFLNANGDYEYKYPSGKGLSLVAQWNREENDNLDKSVEVYSTSTKSPIAEATIFFDCEPIKLSDKAYSWSASVSPVPKSRDDVLNLFIYPNIGDGLTPPTAYNLTAGIRYTEATTRRSMQTSAKLQLGANAEGEPVFYAIGIGAQDLDSIQGVDIVSDAMTAIKAPLEHAEIQRVRNGVLVETYYLFGVVNAGDGGSMMVYTKRAPENVQSVFVQFDRTMEEQTLVAQSKDLMLAVYFRSVDGLGQELRSRYLYLSDMGYKSVHGGQVVEFDFDLGDVRQITGVSLVQIGALQTSIEHVWTANQRVEDGVVTGDWSIEPPITVTKSPVRTNPEGTVGLVSLKFTTSLDEGSISSGTKDPVRLTVGYYDIYGAEQEAVFEDARPYINDGKGFVAGGTDTLRLLVPGLSELRYVDLEPYTTDGDETTLASWKLEKASARVGLDGPTINRTVDKRIVEGHPERVFLADILMIGTVYLSDGSTTKPAGDDTETEGTNHDNTITVGERKSYSMASGVSMAVAIRLAGSTEGVEGKLLRVDPVTGAEETVTELTATHGFTQEEVQRIYSQALASAESTEASLAEREAARKVLNIVGPMLNATGTFTAEGNEVVFTPPRNYTGSKVKYIIEVNAKENRDAKFWVECVVDYEKNDLQAAYDELLAVMSAGSATVINASDGSTDQTVLFDEGGNKAVLVDGGDTVNIYPRVAVGESFTATIQAYDPATGAAGTVSLKGHSYSDSELKGYASAVDRAKQETGMDNDAWQYDQTVRPAAEALQNAAAKYQSAAGSFDASVPRFVAPQNYTGANQSYLITVNKGTDLLFSLTVTVRSSETLNLAVLNSTLEDAISKYNTEKGSEEPSSEGDKPGYEETTDLDTLIDEELAAAHPEFDDAKKAAWKQLIHDSVMNWAKANQESLAGLPQADQVALARTKIKEVIATLEKAAEGSTEESTEESSSEAAP